MDHYLIKGGACRRSFEVLDPSGQVLASLRFPSVWSSRAEAVIQGRNMLLAPVNMWGRRYTITSEGRSIGSIGMGAFRPTAIQVELGDRLWDLRFKRKGFFRWRYELSTDQGVPLLLLRNRMRWFAMDHEVELPGPGVPMAELPLLLCLSGFTAILLHKRAAAAAAA